MIKKLIVITSLLFSISAHAVDNRSVTQKHNFIRANPCPAQVAHKKYSCPGYIVDHIEALACGGPDIPANMQWQTIAESKAKDKWERKGCKARTRI